MKDMGNHSGGSKATVKPGSDGTDSLKGHAPSTGNKSCTGSKGQGHVRSAEGHSGS